MNRMTPASSTPSSSSSASDHRWSYPQSISNSSVHTISTTHGNGLLSRDSLPLITSGPYRNQDFNVPDPKSRDSLEKSPFCLQNESQSSISTVLGPKPDDHTPTPTPTQGTRFVSPHSAEDEDEDESSPPSTPRASLVSTLSLKTDPILSPGPRPLAPRTTPSLFSPPLDHPVSHHEPHNTLHTPHNPPHHSRRRSVTTTPITIHEVEPDPISIVPSIRERDYHELLSIANPHAAAAASYKDHFVPTRQPPPPPASSTRRASPITVEYHKPSKQSIREYQELLSNVNIHPAAAASYKDHFVPTRQPPPPPASSTRRASPITVEYHKPSKQSIREYQEPLPDVKLHSALGANYKDPFVPSRQAHPPTITRHASKSSSGQDPSVSHHKSRSSLHKPSHHSRRRSVVAAPTTIHEVESDPLSTTKDMAASSIFPTPPRPSRANTVNLNDLYTNPNPPPVYDTASRNGIVTTKGKKGILGFMTEFLNLNKRPEISTPYDPVHLAHGGFNSSTGEFTGLPKEWQQLLQDSGISKSDQEKNPLAVMEVVKFYQEGGGDVWDKMGHSPTLGVSHRPASYRPVPSPHQPMQPILDMSTSQRTAPKLPRNDTLVLANTIRGPHFPAPPTAVKADLPSKSQSSIAVNTPVTERQALQPPTAPQRREKKEDKTNDADIVKRLQQICTDADPTRLYRNLVKIGQG